jgi:hypothetical protein
MIKINGRLFFYLSFNENIYMHNPFALLNTEQEIFDSFRKVPRSRIKYHGNFFRCLRIERLLKSHIYKRNWIDSSKDTSPDFHNDRQHIMMEIMKIDDSVSPSVNSFYRKDKCLRSYIGDQYKDMIQNCTTFVIPDTTNDDEYNFDGYLKNFNRVLLDHSSKVGKYHEHFPNCKTCILFICDESSAYYQKINADQNLIHICFNDSRFVNLIKELKSDFVVWYTPLKIVHNNRNKEIKLPLACIFDVKKLMPKTYNYPQMSMQKVK